MSQLRKLSSAPSQEPEVVFASVRCDWGVESSPRSQTHHQRTGFRPFRVADSGGDGGTLRGFSGPVSSVCWQPVHLCCRVELLEQDETLSASSNAALASQLS